MELHACYFKDLGAFSTDQRRASVTAGKLEPGRLVSAIGLLIPQCRPGRTTKTPRLQGNLSRRSRSYGHSMGVNTPARKSALVPGVFGMVTYLALYPALKHLDRALAALGAVVGGSASALTLAIPTTTTGAPALVYLSDQFMATADPARRAVFTTAAETLIAQNRTTVVVGPLTTVGLLIVSIVMLKGVFPKAVAYLGVAAGVLGIAAEALRMVFEGFYAIAGLLPLIWMGAVGWNLYRLGRSSAAVPAVPVAQPVP